MTIKECGTKNLFLLYYLATCVVQIKKNGQVIRTVTVRRKTKKFTDHWARTF